MIALRRAVGFIRVALQPLIVVVLIIHLVLGVMSGLFLIAGASPLMRFSPSWAGAPSLPV
ncbi:hypothetical protein [Actinomadura sp. 6N118]|uniref:hypothetical protein n=1 Tax=Actinomadura sp. 6N118 TaxID=3375151 RepID=UPI00379C4F20